MPYSRARVGLSASSLSRAPRCSTTAAWWPAAASARAFATTGDASGRRWSRAWCLDIGTLSPAYQPTAHSIISATAYSQKCGQAYVNDFSSTAWLAPSSDHASLWSSRYQRPSSFASIWLSVLSTTPSPFRSPSAPPYQSFICAGAPNCSPLGSSATPIFVVSMVTVMRTESPTANRPERRDIPIEAQGRCQRHRSGAVRVRRCYCGELLSLTGPTQELWSRGSFHRCGLVPAPRYREREGEHQEGAARELHRKVSKGWALDCVGVRRQYWT